MTAAVTARDQVTATPAGHPVPGPTLMSAELRRLAAELGDLSVGHLYATAQGSALYDALTAGDSSEIDAMVAASRGLRGPVLDLGCGSGRLTFPFAIRGHHVTALDDQRAMLDQLDKRLAQAPQRIRDRVELVLAEMAGFDLGDRLFDLIVLGTTTVTLLDPPRRAATFHAVARHLAPQGKFLVSTLEVADPGSPGHVTEHSQLLAVLVDGATHVVSVVESVDFASRKREVAVVDFGPIGSPLGVSVHVNQPNLVDSAELADEVGDAGLNVVAIRRHAPAGSPRGAVLLECRRRVSR
jgi:SAM-dependent methyltransferase